jgi:hypothetical protein
MDVDVDYRATFALPSTMQLVPCCASILQPRSGFPPFDNERRDEKACHFSQMRTGTTIESSWSRKTNGVTPATREEVYALQ